MLRICQKLASIVQFLERSFFKLLVTSASDLPFIKCDSVLFTDDRECVQRESALGRSRTVNSRGRP